MNRLISAQNSGSTCSTTTVNGRTEYWGNNYGYDAWGNLISKSVTKCSAENLSVTVSANNQFHGAYTYDAAGNMTYDATANLNYSYDGENRISTVGGSSAKYTYGPDGERVRKDVGSNYTEYIYFGGNVIAERDQGGNWTDYVFFNGERVARHDSGGVLYYFSDHLKTTDIVTDAQGNIKNESDFYPWGGELQRSANDPNNHYKFTGKERDSETGLDYFGARYYSNALGRFVTPDWAAKATAVPYAEFADPQSLNLYSYVRNIPTTRADVDGHQCPACAVINQIDSQMPVEERIRASSNPLNLLPALMAVAPELAATTLARNLVGVALATAPKTMPIVVGALEGLTPGPSGTLTISQTTRLTSQEINTGVRLAEQTGARLVQSEHVGAEFVDAANKTYDAMGGGKAFNAKNFGDGTKFMESIVKHVNKSVDKVAIDLKGASKDQVGAIKDFVKTLTTKQQDKVIYVQ